MQRLRTAVVTQMRGEVMSATDAIYIAHEKDVKLSDDSAMRQVPRVLRHAGAEGIIKFNRGDMKKG
jgi:hypothetical protein